MVIQDKVSPILKSAVPEFGEVALGLTGAISDTLDILPETLEFVGGSLGAIGSSIGGALFEALLSLLRLIASAFTSVLPSGTRLNFNPMERVNL